MHTVPDSVALLQRERVLVTVPEPEMVGLEEEHRVGDTLPEMVGLAEEHRVGDAVPEKEPLPVLVTEALGEPLGTGEALRLTDPVADPQREPVAVVQAELVTLRVRVFVTDCVPVMHALEVRVKVCVPLTQTEMVAEGDGEDRGLAVLHREAVPLGLNVGLWLCECVPLGLPERVGLADPETDEEKLLLPELLPVTETVTLAAKVALPRMETVGVALLLRVRVRDTLTVPLLLASRIVVVGEAAGVVVKALLVCEAVKQALAEKEPVGLELAVTMPLRLCVREPVALPEVQALGVVDSELDTEPL